MTAKTNHANRYGNIYCRQLNGRALNFLERSTKKNEKRYPGLEDSTQSIRSNLHILHVIVDSIVVLFKQASDRQTD